MDPRLKKVVALAVLVIMVGCATTAGGLVGAGIGRATGDTATGAMIGAGVGMMIDVLN